MIRLPFSASRLPLLLLALSVVACGGSTEPPLPEPPPPPPPPPSATQLAFTVPPTDLRAQEAFATAPAVEIRDAAGARIGTSTANVTLTLAGGTPGAMLRGTATVAAVNGVATFPGLSIDSAGTGYTLVASSSGLTSATSAAFAVRRAPVVLAFRTQPVSDEAGLPFTTQPVVEIRDSATGAVLTDRQDTVALAITSRPSNGLPPGTLQGTMRVPAVAGVATFSGLSIDVPGPDYVLTASAAGAASVESAPFIVRAITVRLQIASGDLQEGAPGQPLPQPIRIRVVRAAGNTPLAGQTVTFQTGNGSSVNPTSAVSDQEGLVSTTWTLGTTEDQLLAARSGDAQPVIVVARAVPSTIALSQLTAGDFFFCGVLSDGPGAVCWGAATSGQLGNGPAENPGGVRTVPAPVSGEPLLNVDAGSSTACGTIAGDFARCWGLGTSGQLGNNASSSQSSPVSVAGPQRLRAIAVGATHTCGIDADSRAVCWGSNARGQLGIASTSGFDRTTPRTTAGDVRYTVISSGFDFTCGVTTDGLAVCWGLNASNQLGNNSTTNAIAPTAVVMPAGVRFRTLASGSVHSCAISTTGQLFCWGDNSAGQLGDGTTIRRAVPTPVASSLLFSDVALGQRHTCALAVSLEAYCWGNNGDGALGDDTRVSRSAPGAPVFGGRRWRQLAASSQSTCGLELDTGQAFCWGSSNSGALGNGTRGSTSSSARPVPVSAAVP